jgi:hypothetical protein
LPGGLANQSGLRPRLEQVGELLAGGKRAAADDHEEPLTAVEPRASQDLLDRVSIESSIPAEVLAQIDHELRGLHRVRHCEHLVPLSPVVERAG